MEDFTRKDLETLINWLVDTKEPELSNLKNFWNHYQDVAVAAEAQLDWVNEFTDFLLQQKDPMAGTLYGRVTKHLLHEELRLSTRSTLFRENSAGMTFLTRFWYRKEGVDYLKKVVRPLIKQLGRASSSLEVDPTRADKGVSVKHNSRVILKAVDELIQRIYEAEKNDSFPKFYKIVFQALDSMATVRYQDVGLSLIGGVLFLRLINPAIVFPKKFGVIKGEVTADGQRALLIASKLLQRLANEQTFSEDLEPSMLFANRFIKKELPAWKSFFHKFITGHDEMSASTAVKMDIEPEDLVNIANQDIMHMLICPITKSKQREMFHRLFQLEKQIRDWETETTDGVTFRYKKFKGSSILVASTELVVKGSAEDAASVLRKICGGTETEYALGRDSGFEREILVTYNENLRVVHTTHKAHPLFKARDFVTLNHLQVVPEENFAITCCASIEKEEYPKTKECIRGDILNGCIFRGDDKTGTTTITILLHLDTKGLGKVTPGFMLRKGVMKTHMDFARLFQQGCGTPVANRKSTV